MLSKNLLKHLVKITLFAVFILSTSLIFPIPLAEAVSSERGMIVSPPTQEIEVDRNVTYELYIDIQNDTSGNDTLNITQTVETFQTSDNEGVPEIREFDKNDQRKSWVSFDQPIYNLRKGESKKAKVNITIPKDAEAGGYYFAIVFENNPSTSSQQSQVIIKQRIATLLFVNVRGKAQREVSFDSINTDKQIYDPLFDPIDIKYKIRVEGNSFFKPSGNIFISSNDKQSESVLNVNPEQKIIFPNSTRSFGTNITPLFQTDGFSIPKKNEDVIERPWIGESQIQVKVVYINSNQEITQKIGYVKIFFFPWRLALVLLFVLCIVASVIWFFILRKKKMLKKS